MQRIEDAIAVAKETFRAQLNTRIRAADGVMIETLDFPAPAAALEVHCGAGALADDLASPAGRYFRRHLAGVAPTWLTFGYGTPITAFVVENVVDMNGCSLGPLTDYVTVDLTGMAYLTTHSDRRPSTLAHELVHACGLGHAARKSNLMYRTRERGRRLNRLQKAIARGSRHVTVV